MSGQFSCRKCRSPPGGWSSSLLTSEYFPAPDFSLTEYSINIYISTTLTLTRIFFFITHWNLTSNLIYFFLSTRTVCDQLYLPFKHPCLFQFFKPLLAQKPLKLSEFKPWFIWELSGLRNQFHDLSKLHDSLNSRVVDSVVSIFRLSLSVLM